MNNINKIIFLNAVKCPTLGWMMRNEKLNRTPTLAEQFRMKQGNEIGKKAQQIYPDGMVIYTPNLEATSKKTIGIMKDKLIPVIFEGTFLKNDYVAKADILKLVDGKWHMIEVKSSVNDKEELIDDMAYTTMIINRCGFDVSSISLQLVSKDFRLGMKNEDFFNIIDHTSNVLTKVKEFEKILENINEITKSAERPDSKLKYECKNCKIFKECLGKDIENHIFNIPRLGQSKFDDLSKIGIFRIEDIPDDFKLSPAQLRVRNCIKKRNQFIGDNLKKELDAISQPAYYLDFESVMTAIPFFPNTAPYTQIPTQYSIHKCSEPGKIIGHEEYIGNPKKDWRQELTENLIKNLKGNESIIAYGSFEKNMINNLKEFFPNLSDELDSLVDRLVNLEAIIRSNYYHPNFHGSTSIKTTFPTLVPEMSYNGLEIADGDTASATFVYMIQGKYDGAQMKEKRNSLLKYCEQDSLAMVKLHHKLYSIMD